MSSAIRVLFALGALLLLSACMRPGQNVYSYKDVGSVQTVSFGTVVASRQIDIKGENTGTGALVGGAAGAGAGSYIGGGSGNAWAIAGGAIAGIAAGALAEQAMADRTGIEYTVTLETGLTVTVAQEVAKGDVILQPGARVMVQNSGGYQRVLPASHLPEEIKRPKGIKVVDE